MTIRDPSTVPEGGWQYPHPISGMVTTFNYQIFYEKVVEAYKNNNVQPPTLDEVIKYVCEHSNADCMEGSQPLIKQWIPSTRGSSCCSGYKMLFPVQAEAI